MKVLVIGSGPIVIGQAAEFDYAGTQACKALREEGHSVVLINSNPATIMTDEETADVVYIEPLTVAFCERVIARERPDGLLPTLGGQTGLNLASQLAQEGILDKYNVKLLGTPLEAIQKAEDRELFRALMRELREPVPESFIIETEDQLRAILPTRVPGESGREIEFPYPRIVRPAYTLGGTGGGIANSPEELWEIGRKGLKLSMRSQLMIERSLLGWKEIEYEVMRDRIGTCITICNMENLDPMGVHTGDSIVVAPSQTLSDLEYHMLRTASLKIIRALGIEGGCNVQLAVNPESFDYYVIEVNPRVSRSSALASKATGYPIARVAAKIAMGKTLDEIENAVTGTTKACFEPALDYCVVKIPRWPFDKFGAGDRTLFTQMKATGEVMAIDRTFEAALMKAIRGLEIKPKDLRHPKFDGREGVPPSRAATVSVAGDRRPLFEVQAETKKVHNRNLPHWTRDGAIYHVVFRLADSVPDKVAEAWKQERLTIEEAKETRRLSAREAIRSAQLRHDRIQKLLDDGQGASLLRDPRAAQIVIDSLRHFDGQRYDLYAWCVMPNHVHVVVRPGEGVRLDEVLHSWKSFTAHAINKALGLTGALWLPESYDHIIDSPEELEAAIQYVIANPERAGLSGWEFVGRREIATETVAARVGETPTLQGERMGDEELRLAIKTPTDERLWAVAEGLRRGWPIKEIHRISRIDPWFLEKIRRLVDMESRLSLAAERRETRGRAGIELSNLIYDAFLAGYPSPTILAILESNQGDAFAELARREVDRLKVQPVFKMVDTCAGEFESRTPYYYGTFEDEDDAIAR